MTFPADIHAFTDAAFTEDDLTCAAFLLYGMGRDIECGFDETAVQMIRTLCEQDRALVVRALAAAYTALQDAP